MCVPLGWLCFFALDPRVLEVSVVIAPEVVEADCHSFARADEPPRLQDWDAF